jgi:hypothetical protein
LYIFTLARVTARPVGFVALVVPKDNPIEWRRTPTKRRWINDLTPMHFPWYCIQLVDYHRQLLYFAAIRGVRLRQEGRMKHVKT